MHDVAVIACAAKPIGRYGRRGKDAVVDGFELELLGGVISDSLKLAGLGPAAIDALVLPGPAPTLTQQGFANFIASRLGLLCTSQLTEVSNLGLSGGQAFDLAAAEIMLGRADYALAAGVDTPSTMRGTPSALAPVAAVSDVDFEAFCGATPISWYALGAARYLHETGASHDCFAPVAVKNRNHAQHNPIAQYRQPISLEDFLGQRPVADPLGLLDVAPVSDGAISLVLCRADLAAGKGIRHMRLKGRGFGHDGNFQAGSRPRNLLDYPAARLATQQAIQQSDVPLDQLHCAELYAPTTFTEVLLTEALGLCPFGQGAALAASGATTSGGRLPINTSGGCLSRGHPPGLSALYGIFEVFQQLTGGAEQRQISNARFGLSLCEGGLYNVALAHVFEGLQ